MAGEEEAVSTAQVTEHSGSDLDSYFDESPEGSGESAPEGTLASSDESASQAEAKPEEQATEEVQAEVEAEAAAPAEEEAKAAEPYKFAGREFESEEVAANTYAEAQTAMQANMAEVKVLKEQNQRYEAMLQGAVGPKADAQPPAQPNRFTEMNADAFDAELLKGGYGAHAEATREAMLDSGLLEEVMLQAEARATQKVWGQVEPMMKFISKLKVDDDLREMGKDASLAELLPGMEKDIRAQITAPGNTLSVKAIVDGLLAKQFPSAQKELAQLKASLAGKTKASATASAATRGTGTVPAKPAAPAAKTPEDDFFGQVTVNEDIEGTGLKVAR